jgi:hypothetical protein
MLALWLLRGIRISASVRGDSSTGGVNCFQLKKKHIRDTATHGKDPEDGVANEI